MSVFVKSLAAAATALALTASAGVAHAGGVDITAQQPNAPVNLDRIDQLTGTDSVYTYPDSAGAGVTIYVIDTGGRITHDDFGSRASGDTDCNGHGTHAGSVAAGAEYGVAKRAELVFISVLNCNGGGTVADVIAAVNQVTTDAAQRPGRAVALMELGGAANTAVDTAVTQSIASGVPYVVTAGNDNADACAFSPARVTTALTVGGTDQAGTVTTPSGNWGPCVDIYAPDRDITAAWHTGDSAVATLSGTGAAAHVAGALALYLSLHPDATPGEAGGALLSNAGTVMSASGPVPFLYTGFMN